MLRFTDAIASPTMSGFLEAFDNPTGDFLSSLGSVESLTDHRELVAVQPRKGVLGAEDVLDALNQLYQHAVADVVTECVVDGLEVVDVEKENRSHLERPT